MVATTDTIDERRLRAKLDRRVLILPTLLGIISIIDRVNIGFAKKSLSADLALSTTAYGFGAGILFLGYFAFEIPSNKALAKFGARVWLCRIAVTWGIICSLTAFVFNDVSFYIARFLLGAAEAGLFPGVVLYLTYWYPLKWRARAIGIFMACIPAASIIGGPLAGWLLSLHEVAGLRDWQWLFLVEGLPAVALGLLLIGWLPNRPSEASWLDQNERAFLEEQLSSESRGDVAGHVKGDLRAIVRSPYVWLFTLIYFCYACGSYGLAFFLPSIIAGFGNLNPLAVGGLTAVPYAVGALAMVLVARRSDRTGERRWHLAIPFLVAAVGLLSAGLSLSAHYVAYALFILTVAALMTCVANFWARPTRLLAGTAAASGIAVINSFGNIGGFAGPYAFGALVDLTGGRNVAGLVMLAGLLAIAGLIVLSIRAGARDTDVT